MRSAGLDEDTFDIVKDGIGDEASSTTREQVRSDVEGVAATQGVTGYDGAGIYQARRQALIQGTALEAELIDPDDAAAWAAPRSSPLTAGHR